MALERKSDNGQLVKILTARDIKLAFSLNDAGDFDVGIFTATDRTRVLSETLKSSYRAEGL